MLDLAQIESFYSEPVRVFKKNILREYLQYKILEIIFESKFANRLVFMGGTSIRIIHGGSRFSEILDFDNFGLTKNEFEELSKIVQKKLILEGYAIEMRTILRGALHGHLGFLNILDESGIAKHRDEKLKIKMDTEPQGAAYQPEKIIINKFDVFTRINVVPNEILLSQKLFAILNRKRTMGRDVFDAIFLFGRSQPDFDYLKLKAKISSLSELKEQLLAKCAALDFEKLAKDVEPFLLKAGDSKKILLFRAFVESLKS